MYKYLVIVVILLLEVSTAAAASWNVFNHAFNDKSIYFFDADTVIKKGSTVTIWTKYVKNDKYPDDDGSFSTAQRFEISCNKRKYQTLISSIYDKDRKFIKSYTTPTKILDIAPETIAEAVYKAACTPDFPNNKSKEQYFPVIDNDIYKHASDYYKLQEAIYTDLAPTTSATWNVFNRAFNDKTSFYFDANSVVRIGDLVTVWLKSVQNKKYPVEDGVYSRAQKTDFSCTKRTAQDNYDSTYDKDGKYIRSYVVPGDIVNITEGTLYAGMLKAVCSPDFPSSSSKELYFPVVGNDIIKETDIYYKSQEDKKTDIAPI